MFETSIPQTPISPNAQGGDEARDVARVVSGVGTLAADWLDWKARPNKAAASPDPEAQRYDVSMCVDQ